jgi:regulator of sigma E protease
MLDEHEPGAVAYDRREGDVSYTQLGVWWRIAIAFGGPLANFLLAIIVYWILFVVGSTSYAPMLGEIGAETPLSRAGLVANEELVAIDGVPTRTWQQVNMALAARLGDTGNIEFTTTRPGSADQRTGLVQISRWHTGVDEPDLFGSLGIQPVLTAIIAQVLPDSPAERAGLQVWDRVESVDDQPVARWSTWVELIQQAPGRTLAVRVDRAGRSVDVNVTPDVRVAEDGSESGYLGVGAHTNEVRYAPFAALPRSFAETWDKTLLTLGLLKKMVTGQVSVKNLSGPITIAKVAGDSARSGWRYFCEILALLSISLAVLNLLPIPILDGGHILFCSAEALTGKPVSERVQVVGTQIGLFMVASLMILAIYNDISRLF